MYKSIYKSSQVILQKDDAIVIDNNDRVAREIELLKASMIKSGKEAPQEDSLDGFSMGLDAEEVDVLLSDGDGSLIQRNGQEAAAGLEEASAQAEQILSEARTEAERIKAEAAETARAEAEEAKSRACEEGKRQGYEEGCREGMAQADSMKRQLEQEKKRLEDEYRNLVDDLEPEFIRTLTNIYEHVFQIDLQKEHDIVVHLLENAMQRMEGNSNYLIHVSREDYPYVSMKKEELLAKAVSGSASVEIVEDVTLGANDCMIETDSGIFDCGLGTQLEELSKKLRLLSCSGE